MLAGPIWTRGALRGREVGAGNRGRRGRPWSARGPNAATTRSDGPGDFNPCRHRSCWRVAGGAGAARWCRERWWRCSTRGRTSRVAAPSRVRWSVIRTRGPSRPPVRHWRQHVWAAVVCQRRWTSLARPGPRGEDAGPHGRRASSVTSTPRAQSRASPARSLRPPRPSHPTPGLLISAGTRGVWSRVVERGRRPHLVPTRRERHKPRNKLTMP